MTLLRTRRPRTSALLAAAVPVILAASLTGLTSAHATSPGAAAAPQDKKFHASS